MSESAILRNESNQLILCVLLLLPFAYLADSAVNSLIFQRGSLLQQIFHPSSRELAARGLSCLLVAMIALPAILFLRKASRLEGQLRTHNEELHLANQEMEAFHHTLCHDLRNSLTIIYTSMEMLRDHCQIGKNTQCRFLLSSICKYSEKMEAHIECMLLLSRKTADDLPRKEVLLNAMAAELFDQYLPHTEPRPRISIEEDLIASCNVCLTRMALGILISEMLNRLSFEQPAEIMVGMTRRQGESVFFLRESGRQAADNEFDLTFPDASETTGAAPSSTTPLGLATARRIIERHGGRLWQQSQPGEGRGFYFTLAPSR